MFMEMEMETEVNTHYLILIIQTHVIRYSLGPNCALQTSVELLSICLIQETIHQKLSI